MRHAFSRANAKLNLTLDVIGKRENGYHDLRMVMQSISLGDSVCVRTGCGGGSISVISNVPYIPDDERNIAVKAARAFFEGTGVPCDGVNITIEKRIPSSAGLGGGSADGAAVLRLMNELYHTELPLARLCEIGLSVGADVPFCISGGTALAEGLGERLTAISPLPHCFFVLCKPKLGMSTKKVFGKIDVARLEKHPDTDGMLAAIEAGSLSGIGDRVYNVLEDVVGKEYPEILRIKSALLQNGALAAAMSGSGSTVFGMFDSEAHAKKAYRAMKARYAGVFIAEPIL